MECGLQRLPCLVHPLVREIGCLFIPVAPARPVFPSLVQVRCTVKSWCLAWRNKFVSCNEWAECQWNVFPQQPRELAGGQQQLACPAKGPAALVREKPVLVGMCSLSGGAFGQKGRVRVWGGEIPTGSCLEVWFRVGMSVFFGRAPVLRFQLLQAKLSCW